MILTKKTVFAIISFFILAIALTALIISLNRFFGPVERQVLEVQFRVAEYPGFDGNRSGLFFGAIIPGGAGHRFLSFHNPYGYNLRLKVLPSSNIENFLIIRPPEVFEPYGNYSIGATISVPRNASYSNYSGYVVFEFWK